MNGGASGGPAGGAAGSANGPVSGPAGGPAEIVTGEAVALDLQPATFASRAVSGGLDLIGQSVLLFGVAWVVSHATGSLDEAAASAVFLVSFLAVVIGYPLVLETLTRGRTLGKLAMGLRTVRDDGGPIRFRQALVRALVEVVEVWLLLGSPALIASLASARGKRLGDQLAGTYVVRERGAATRSMPPLMPYELAGWAQLVDIGRLPDGLAIAVRQFLGRAPSMHPQARAAMGYAMARDLSAFVAPLPPVGTPPEAYLAAVLAERRRRDELRLARDAAFLARLTGRGGAAGGPGGPGGRGGLGGPGSPGGPGPWVASRPGPASAYPSSGTPPAGGSGYSVPR